jgi:hypothetical protein
MQPKILEESRSFWAGLTVWKAILNIGIRTGYRLGAGLVQSALQLHSISRQPG